MALKLTRRSLFENAVVMAGILPVSAAQRGQQSNKKDDYTICAGTIARYAHSGHQALLYSFTPGDSRSMADMNGLALDELAANRREDALKGAQILGAELRFLDQRNQNMQVNLEVYNAFNKLLAAEKPDVVFGMWPLEFHPDHRAVANISTMHGCRAGSRSGISFARHRAVER